MASANSRRRWQHGQKGGGASLWSESDRRAAYVMSGGRGHLETDSDSDATPLARRDPSAATPSPTPLSPAEEHAALSAELSKLQERLAARSSGAHRSSSGASATRRDTSGAHGAAELLAEAHRLTNELSSAHSPLRSMGGHHDNSRNASPSSTGSPAAEGRAQRSAVQRTPPLTTNVRHLQAQLQSLSERLESSERARVQVEAEAEAWKVASLEAEAKAEAWRTASLAAEDAAHAAAAAQAEAEEERLNMLVSELQEQNRKLLTEARAHAEQLQHSEEKLREEAAARDQEVAGRTEDGPSAV
eukprot:COSAG03_NODE_4205_length_1640_cov_2.249189_2_plen_302_part_00